MALTASQQRRLDEVRSEIDQLDHRIAVAHGLGDSSSVQGTTASFTDVPGWTKRRDQLRRLRDNLEAIEAGDPPPANTGILLSRWRST
jgi:hypothetical protein